MKQKKIPVLTIIIPIYNGERHIDNCISSIFKNLNFMNDVEIILINDGSTDNTLNVIEKYTKKENFHIINQQNSGVSFSRNKGVKKASGKYIWFVDSDDEILSENINYLISVLKNNNFDWILFNYLREKEKNAHVFNYKELKILNEKEKKSIIKMFIEGNYLNSVCTKIFNRSLLIKNDLKFIETLKYGEDRIFNMNYIKQAKNIAIVSKSLYYYKYNSLSATNNFTYEYFLSEKLKFEYMKKFAEYYNVYDENTKKILLKRYVKSYVGNLEYYTTLQKRRFPSRSIKEIINENMIDKDLKRYLNENLFSLKKETYLFLLNHLINKEKYFFISILWQAKKYIKIVKR